MKDKVLLVGPKIETNRAKYGGGVGGYTRNMVTYLQTLAGEKFEFMPCFHTVRTAGKAGYLKFPIRMIVDAYRLIEGLQKGVSIVHMLGQYRSAIYREYLFSIICKYSKTPYVYELKAGAFINWYNSTFIINKAMARFVLKNASKVLCEGLPYVDFLQSEFSLPSEYWPNFVPSDEVPKVQNTSKKADGVHPLKICFIGYCYHGKGIFELVEGLNIVANKGIDIELNIIGHESEEFKEFLGHFELSEKFTINRFGKQSHDKVLDILKRSDLFYLPSKHKGEGHNNSINEAMMLNIPIICSKQGFSYHLLKDGMAIFVEDVSPVMIAQSIYTFLENDCGHAMAEKANNYFTLHLHSNVVIPKLMTVYKSILNKGLSK